MTIETRVYAGEQVFKLREVNRKGGPGQHAPDGGGGGAATSARGKLGRQQLFVGTVDN